MKTSDSIILKAACILLILILTISSGSAQTNQRNVCEFGAGVESFVSCNGHGTFYSPHVSILKNLNTLSIGAMIQKRTGIVSGLKITYLRDLTGGHYYNYEYPDILQLNFTSSVQYNNKQPLSYSTIKYQEMIDRESTTSWNNVKVATVQANAGFELQLNITNNLFWKTNIAASYYNHFKCETKLANSELALTVGTSINFIIN